MSEFGEDDLVVDRMSMALGNLDAADDGDVLTIVSSEFGDGGHGVIASMSSIYDACNVLDSDDLGEESGILVVVFVDMPPLALVGLSAVRHGGTQTSPKFGYRVDHWTSFYMANPDSS